jgi:hypothetical protein
MQQTYGNQAVLRRMRALHASRISCEPDANANPTTTTTAANPLPSAEDLDKLSDDDLKSRLQAVDAAQLTDITRRPRCTCPANSNIWCARSSSLT